VALIAITGTYTHYAGGQLAIMRSTLNADRPWVGISGSGNFRLDLTENGPIVVTMNAPNSGRTPALNLVSVNKLTMVSSGDATPDFSRYSKSEASPAVVLFPGSVTTIKLDTTIPSAEGNSVAHLTQSQIAVLKSGSVRLFVYGSIWYDDTLHSREHRTDYCFVYNPDPSQPVITANFGSCPTHNNAD
jgi:hypothetical protein